jgi:hypothetical protein
VTRSPALLAEQLRVATELYREAVRKGALLLDASSGGLGAQLAAVSSSPRQETLLAWVGNFRSACIGTVPPRTGQPMPAEEHIEIAALMVAAGDRSDSRPHGRAPRAAERTVTRDGTRRGVLVWLLAGLVVLGLAVGIGLWAAT